MARVKGGLFSIEASGQFAQSLVFDKRGYVRQYVEPSNAKTEAQGNQRQKFQGLQRAVGGLNTVAREAAGLYSPTTYRWGAYVNSQMNSYYNDVSVQYAALAPATQDEWDAAANGGGLFETSPIEYATNAVDSAGKLLYLLAYVFYVGMGDPGGVGDLAAGGAAVAWAGYLL
ncbi:MAG: hypothetical protein AAFO87_12705 [Cyanobacteria bacterium J06607_6]